MIQEEVFGRYLEALLVGDRRGCRAAVEETLQKGIPAISVYSHMIWPVMVEIERLSRAGRIDACQEHLATRINRTIVDQLQNKLPRRPSRGKKMVVCCAAEELQELGAQMMVDLFESDGWEVRFLGGGLTNDDILEYVNGYGPDLLVIYGTTPRQAPDVRRLIDTVRDVNAWPDMRIMVSGGLFNRAEGLWEEIGADAFAATAAEAIHVAAQENTIPGEERRTLNRRKRRRRDEEAEAAVGLEQEVVPFHGV